MSSIYSDHRSIWESHHGPIPEGYEIHHINGDPTDNRIENLLCVTLSEHFDIHYNQGDYGACYLIATRMSDEYAELKEKANVLQNKQRIEARTHNFLKENRSHPMGNEFTSETAGKTSRRRVAEGTHNFLKLKGIPKDANWHAKAPKSMRSKPRASCIQCKNIYAAHHLNRHLSACK